MPKRVQTLAVIAFVLLMVYGCGNNTSPISSTTKRIWQLALLGYETKGTVPDEFGLGSYAPDPGYTWLVITLRMSNMSKEQQGFDFITSSWSLIDSEANRYSAQLLLNSPVNAL